MLRGLVASATEPIAGGRHKVFGRADLNIIPTTSTIASHLPRAVGLGLPSSGCAGWTAPGGVPGPGRVGSGAAPRTPPGRRTPSWSARSATPRSTTPAATAAFNTAGWYDHAGLRLPLLFVCEDNGLGISVRSPEGWVEATLRAEPGLRYFSADGCDLAADVRRWRPRRRPGYAGTGGRPCCTCARYG